MLGLLRHVDSLLRGHFTRRDDLLAGRIAVPSKTLTIAGVLLGCAYGLFMGLYAVLRSENPSSEQLLATVAKVPLLFLATLCVTFPSLYVFSALANSRLTAAQTLRLLLAAITVNLALLASFGPVTAFFTLSTDSYPFLVVLNVVFFALSGFAGLMFLRRVLDTVFLPAPPRPSETEGERDDAGRPLPPLPNRADAAVGRRVFSIWILTYGLVGAQMGWILRPFIGAPTLEFTFFRPRDASFFAGVIEALRALFR
ncbi:MAG: hypothetical protein JNM25_06305 [Planctomycetes bacterium]|nr:hypothetical protein [Planctomycetota bacterium]